MIYVAALGGAVYVKPLRIDGAAAFVDVAIYRRAARHAIERQRISLSGLASLDCREATEGERVGFLLDMLSAEVRANVLALASESIHDLIEASDGLDDERADALRWIRAYFSAR